MIGMRINQKHNWTAYAVYLLMALAVMLPLLRPGFILTLDLVFTPLLRMPDAVTSSYLFHVALHVLNLAVPSEIIEKALLLAILLISSIGMHRLVRTLRPKTDTSAWGIYVASIFFAVNPYTYSRFMAGQYAVLLGYALLPWLVRLCIDFGQKPGWKNALKLGGLIALIATVSIHTLGEMVILGLVVGAVFVSKQRAELGTYVRYGAAAAAIFVVLCGFWLVPLALGQGKTASIIQSFSAADSQAFATTGGSGIGKLGNVMRLQGFWAEGRGLYLLPQDESLLWGLMALTIIALVVGGGVAMYRASPRWTIVFTASGLLGTVLAVGGLSSLLSHIGYREPQKFVGLLALSYSVFMAYGVNATLARLASRAMACMTATVLLLMLPLLFTRVMLWGFDGQLTPRHYPADWATVNTYLGHDSNIYPTLLLPWHQYMSFRFAGRVIANPAPDFFDKPVIVSQNPELGGASSGKQDDLHQAIGQLLAHLTSRQNLGKELAHDNIKYVLLAKELDYRHDAQLLAAHPEMRLVRDFPDIAVYMNTEWRAR